MITGIIEQKAIEKMDVRPDRNTSLARCVVGQLALNRFEDVVLNDRLVLTRIDVRSMPDASDLDRI